MGTNRGMYLELRRPLLILEPDGMPVNLGRAFYEDRPEEPFPVVPFKALNVMPTPLGYKSFFQPVGFYRDNPDTPDPTEGLQNVHFQDIFAYQTINAYNITIGLAEGGIYAYSNTNGAEITTDALKYWTRIREVTAESGVKYLWTRCVLDNIVYFYHQGGDFVYAIVDYATYQERLANDPAVTGIFSNEFYQFGIIAKKPAFLNMEGQIGIFKADNRLGFWDTDGSVAWSSAINKYDFKPDATTFAGITKFTSVTGNITTIKSSGRGFVIYATASVVRVDPASSSERWTSTPIFTTVGVLYPEQVTHGAADTTHYFWANSGGIYEFNGVTAKPYEPELSHFFKSQGSITYLKYLAGKYLFVDISSKDIVDSGASRYGRLVYDGKGNPFVANPPPRFDDPNYNAPFPLSLILQASGMAQDLALGDFEPEPEIFPDPSKDEVLIPCYTGWKFITPGGLTNPATQLKWDTSNPVIMDTTGWPTAPGWVFASDATQYLITNATKLTKLSPDPQYWSYEAGPIVSPPGARFIDQAGQDFIDIITDSLNQITALADRFNILVMSGPTIGTVATPPEDLSNTKWLQLWCTPSPFPGDNYPYPEPARPDPYTPAVLPVATVEVKNVIKSIEFVVEEDGCMLKIKAKTIDVIIGEEVTFEVTKEYIEDDPDHPGAYRYFNEDTMTYYMDLTASSTTRELPATEQEIVIFQCEISGYGYFPYGGFSFRKTHSRSIFKPCEPAGTTSVTIPKDDITDTIANEPVTTTLQYDPAAGINPFYDQGFWDINLKPITPFVPSIPGYPATGYQWANFGKGVYNPYYPTMVKAYVKDINLDKWGVYADAHSLLFDILPINRSERPILLAPELGSVTAIDQDTANIGAIFQANGLDPIPDTFQFNGLPVLLMPFNNYATITYGKIGLSRAGFTRLTGGSFNLGGFNSNDEGFVNVTIRASYNNADYTLRDSNFDDVSQKVSFNLLGSKADEVPFTLDGRWFTITLQGQFDTQFMSLYGHDAGRMRFISSPQQEPQ